MILRPYQSEAVPRIHEALMRSRCAVYVLPTGGGKTVVFAEISRLCHEAGTRAVIGVHRDTLIRQACDKLRSFGVAHTVVAPGRADFGDPVKVASVQTLVRRIDKHPFDLFIVDEGHHAVAGSYRRIIDGNPDASVLLVTATPCRMDGRGLGEVAQELVMGPSIRQLMDDGYLTDAAVYGSAEVAGAERMRVTGGDYNAKDVEELMDRRQVTGDAVDHYRRTCGGQPAIAFCATIRHAEDVAGQFRQAGYRFEAISGKMPASLVRQRLAGLAVGELQGIASCDLISEGFDAPSVVCGILLRQTRSLAVHMQQVGRLLRPSLPFCADTSTRESRLAAMSGSFKPRAVILDHAGNSFRHGLPDEGREWTLDATRKRRTESISLKPCPRCYAHCHPWDRTCKSCGYTFLASEVSREPEQVDGELVRLDPAKMKAMRLAAAKDRRREEGMCRTYAELRDLGIKRGYQPGWAYMKWVGRGGSPAEAR